MNNQLVQNHYENPKLIEFLNGRTTEQYFAASAVVERDFMDELQYDKFCLSNAALKGDLNYLKSLFSFFTYHYEHYETDAGIEIRRTNSNYENFIKEYEIREKLLFDALSLVTIEDNVLTNLNSELDGGFYSGKYNPFYDEKHNVDSEYIGWWNKMHIVLYLLQFDIKINKKHKFSSITRTPLQLILWGGYLYIAIKLHKKNEIIELLNILIEYGEDREKILNYLDFSIDSYLGFPFGIDYENSSQYRKQIEFYKNDFIYNEMIEILKRMRC